MELAADGRLVRHEQQAPICIVFLTRPSRAVRNAATKHLRAQRDSRRTLIDRIVVRMHLANVREEGARETARIRCGARKTHGDPVAIPQRGYWQRPHVAEAVSEDAVAGDPR